MRDAITNKELDRYTTKTLLKKRGEWLDVLDHKSTQLSIEIAEKQLNVIESILSYRGLSKQILNWRQVFFEK
ncbi:MAG: hypothetical protein ACRENZ_06845 [Thermodesulfobacteriota bacterium]